ncbi:MAG TPA: hypothetical protein VN823_05985 [Stellaceae bacterium]|nr:hypothetical protein [Stellaceae bacterium]
MPDVATTLDILNAASVPPQSAPAVSRPPAFIGAGPPMPVDDSYAPLTASGYRPTTLPPANPEDIIANAQRGGGYVPTPEEAKAMSADIAARQPAPAPSSTQPADDLQSKLDILKSASEGKLPAPEAASAPSAGMAANLGAGGMEAVTGILGAPVDLTTWARRQQATAFGMYTPEEAIARGADPALFDGTTQVGGSHWINKQLGRLDNPTVSGFNPEEVPAGDALDRAARAAGAGVGSMVLPAGPAGEVLAARAPAVALGARPAGTVGEATLEALKSGGTPSGIAAGGVGGVTGQVAAEAVPEPYKPLAAVGGQILGGGAALGGTAGVRALTRAPAGAVKDFVAPLIQGGQQRLAGERILGAASEPDLLRGRLDAENGGELVPGSAPTTYQLTGDQGLGTLERTAATANPETFLARRAEQNAARVGAMEGLAPANANSGAVGGALQQQLDALDQHTDALVQTAQARASAKAADLGGHLTDDQYGAIQREALAGAKKQAKAAEGRLWNSIDPDRTLVINSAPMADAAAGIAKDMPQLARPMEGEEAAIFSDAQNLPGAAPFREVAALRSRLNTAIGQERFDNGETPAWRRMILLRQALDNTIASAGQEAAAATNAPVAAGALAGESGTAAGPAGAPQVGGAVFTPSGRRLGVRYEPVEADTLIPSHTQDFRPNPEFPPELQPRERSRVASETQVSNMAANLQPERLGASAGAIEGAPIVGPDNVVESGNARAMALLRAYGQHPERAQAYRDYLSAQGFDTAGMKNPVLIRRRITPLAPDERVRFTQEANASPGLSLSATERAAVDAERMPPSVLELYRGGDIASAENRSFVRAFMGHVSEQNELGALSTADGQLSMEGAARIRNALLSKAYGDSNLIGSLTETGDPNIKAFGGALMNTAGDVARLNGEIKAGRVPAAVDLSRPLLQAAQLVQKARATRTPLADVVAQRDAFSSVSPTAESLLREAYGPDLRGRLSSANFANYLRFVVGEAEKQSTEAGLFGENTVSLGDILAAGGRRYGRSYTEASPSLLSPENAGNPREGGGAPGQGVGRPGSSAPGPETAGRGPEAPGLQQADGLHPALAPNFGPENAAAYRAAANATRERKQTFNAGSVGTVLRAGRQGTPYAVADSSVPGKFFNSGSHAYEDVQGYIKAAGDRPEAIAALQDYAAADLRSYAINRDGVLDPKKFETWLKNHSDALRPFPELATKFSDAAAAQRTVEETAAARKTALDAYQKSAAKYFLGADPVSGVDRALRSRNPVETFRDLGRLTASNPDAREGLRKAAVEYMQRALVGNTEAGGTGVELIKSDKFQTFVKQNRPALAEIFSAKQIDAMDALAEDLQRANRSIAGTKLPGGSNTPQDLAAIAKHGAAHGSRFSMVTQLLAAEAIGHLAESGAGMLGGQGIVGAVAHGAGIGAGLVASAMRTAGLRSVDELVAEAMLHPDLARKLLLKVPLEGNPTAARDLANRIRALTVTAPLTEESEKPPAAPAPQPMPAPMQTSAVARPPVTLASALMNGSQPQPAAPGRSRLANALLANATAPLRPARNAMSAGIARALMSNARAG